MKTQNISVDEFIKDLQEREKELNCLYNVEEILKIAPNSKEAFSALVKVIPAGWQYPNICQAKITYQEHEYRSSDFQPTQWSQNAKIEVGGTIEGDITVYYTEKMPQEFEGPFLQQERQLLDNIADRIGKYIFHRRSQKLMHKWETAKETLSRKSKSEWQVIMELLRNTNQEVFLFIAQKMIYHLCWRGIPEAQELLQNVGANQKLRHSQSVEDENRPMPKVSLDMVDLASQIFDIVPAHLSDNEILTLVQSWIQESRINFLVRTLDDQGASLAEIADAIRRFHQIMPDPRELPEAKQQSICVALVRRFLTEQLEFIRVARDYIDVNDMYDIIKRMIFSEKSHGKIGGKGAGLLLASQIINKMKHAYKDLQNIKIPKTWFVSSDGLLYFATYNNLEGTVAQKYKPIDQVRLEYSHVIQIFKNSPFPADLLRGLSVALDDFGEHPIIVRSSSLLEDRLGTAFSGKYKSLFLANQGSKAERLEALTDAIAEVYASTFGPDPIEYRTERGLLDFHEEMGIMIQQVVGQKVGKYFLPAYAGVAFSTNEFRWSPRIKREDGLIRLVPGLGTRAVDRVADDYPILIAPGQPNLQVNVTLDESIRYTPKWVDVINLETNTFETIKFEKLVKEDGNQFPAIRNIVSIIKGDHLSSPGFMTDFAHEESIVTFAGLRAKTRFVQQMHAILEVLRECIHTPVDLEFASDGKDLYLLQCRPQSAARQTEATPIPKDIPQERIVFSANQFVSNGYVPDITHLVYVVPQAYNDLEDHSTLVAVGRAVSKLNKVLPKRQFILMGPGRWGSRGDIKLGVNVTYSDINNTAALIEVAMKKGDYVPDLSFGTHFFQDLVEASIRYLPLYPDNENVLFNETFLTQSPNVLAQLAPEYSELDKVIKVIDVPKITDGQVLRLAMNADLDEALAYLDSPRSGGQSVVRTKAYMEKASEDHSQWRLEMATYIASQTDPEKFGLKGFYLFGSTKNATAGPTSDINLLLHVCGTEQQRNELKAWLEGWSLCLDEMNYLRTGDRRTGGLLDVHIITDEDIAQKTDYASKIGAVTDAAQELPMMKK